LGTLADGLGFFPLDYEAHPPQSDCHPLNTGIRSLKEFGRRLAPYLDQCSTSGVKRNDANPKVISARTSYHGVRLAFYPYPQLIRAFCNIQRFGPPRDVTLASTWPWIAHPVSGLLPATQRPIQTRFRFGSGCLCLNLATESNSSAHSPRGTPSPGILYSMHQALTACRHTVSGSISLP
jgi:hypothetical protein